MAQILQFPEPAQKLHTLASLVALFDQRGVLQGLNDDERALVTCAAEVESEIIIEPIRREFSIALLSLAIKHKLVRQI